MALRKGLACGEPFIVQSYYWYEVNHGALDYI